MPTSRRETMSGKAYAAPLVWVALLLLCYWVLVQWPQLPGLLNSMKADLSGLI